jgi:hypothetical protein
MLRISLLSLVTAGLLVPPLSTAGDKKLTQRSLAEDAQKLGEKDWISEQEVSLPGAEANNFKFKLTISFAPDKGKPSGKATLGTVGLGVIKKFKTEGIEFTVGAEGGAGFGGYTFELIETAGNRAIKLFLPDAKVNGKPIMTEPRILHYLLEGDQLTIIINQPQMPGWSLEPVKIKFKRAK